MRAELVPLAWLAVTLGGYYALKPLYRRLPRWWTSPLFTVPVLLIALGWVFGTDYPVLDPDRWIRDFEALPIKPEVRPLIMKENAIRMLKLRP